MSKNLEETVRFQSEKRQEWIGEIREERLQGIAEGASSTPHLASSSSASFFRRNECPGTHCNLIEQEEREDSSCQNVIGGLLRLVDDLYCDHKVGSSTVVLDISLWCLWTRRLKVIVAACLR